MSYKAEVIADSSGKWVSNALRFATLAEAESYGHELASRWMAVRQVRAVESADPVNYRFNTETYRAEPIPAAEMTNV